MKYDNFFKISEFAKIGGISRKMLIHYDKMGVLKPDSTDPVTKYRYYSLEQIKTLKMIKSLQFLGISLSEIKEHYIDNNIDEHIENFKREKKRIDAKFLEIQRAKKLIEDQLACLEEISNITPEEEFKIKKLPKRYLISRPLKKPNLEEMTKILIPLEKKIAKWGILMLGELAAVKEYFTESSVAPRHFLGIFSTKDIKIEDTQGFEFKAGTYLSFYKTEFFIKEESVEYAGLWFRENFKCIDLWCEKNGYEVESDILFIPTLLPFFKIADRMYEVQVKVKKIR